MMLVGMTWQGMGDLIYDLLVNWTFGSTELMGAFFLIMLMFIGFKNGWSFDTYVAILIPAMFLIGNSYYNLFPTPVAIFAAIGAGILIAMLFRRLFAQ